MNTTLTAREYQRVSFDKSGRQRSNEEQHEDNLDLGDVLGITDWREPYRDVGSASKHARKRRGDWDQLRADLGSGAFGADLVVVWEISRLSREVDDWPGFLKLCVAAKVRIAVTTDACVYDPANPRDRKALLDGATDAEYESAKVSLRTKRAVRSAAKNGAPHGRCPYGYRRVYDPTSGRIIRQEREPAEAAVVVELFERLAAGHSLAEIARDFHERGITSRGDKRGSRPFAAQTLRGMALAPVYAARRVHQPGDAARAHRGVQAKSYAATWPALVDDELFYAVRARLTDESRRTVRPGRGVHLLSMLARCDVCGAKLAATYRRGPRRYQCHGKGCVLVDADDLDAWAEHQILEVLTRPDVVEGLVRNDDDDDALADARDDVARIRAEHADLVAQVAAGAVSATLAAGSEPGILARLRTAEMLVAELATPSGLRGLIEPGERAIEQWENESTSMAVKREIVRLLFAPGFLGTLSVARATDGRRGEPVADRIRLDGKPLKRRRGTRA